MFRAPVDQGVGWLAVVMAVNVVIGLAYYLAWAASLYAPARSADARPPSYAHLVVGRAWPSASPSAAGVVLSVAPGLVLRFG